MAWKYDFFLRTADEVASNPIFMQVGELTNPFASPATTETGQHG